MKDRVYDGYPRKKTGTNEKLLVIFLVALFVTSCFSWFVLLFGSLEGRPILYENLNPSVEIYTCGTGSTTIDLSENNTYTRGYIIVVTDMCAYNGFLTVKAEKIYPINITMRCGKDYPFYNNGTVYEVMPKIRGEDVFGIIYPGTDIVFDLTFRKLDDFSDGNLTLAFGYMAGYIDKYGDIKKDEITLEYATLSISLKGIG